MLQPPSAAFSPDDNHRDAVGGKTYVLTDVKVVDGLDEPDTAHLEQIIHVLAPAEEFLDHGEGEAQISGN